MVWVFSPKDGDPSCLSKDQRPSAVRDGSLEAALSPDLLRSSLLEPRFRLLPRILINPQAEGWEPNSEVSPLLPYAEEPVRAILEFVYRAHAERRV